MKTPLVSVLVLATLYACSGPRPAQSGPVSSAGAGQPATAGGSSGAGGQTADAPSGGGVSSTGGGNASGGGQAPAQGGQACGGFAEDSESPALVHPGGLHNRSDLERLRYQVAAGQEPWAATFQQLSKDARASKTYVVRGNSSWTDVLRGGTHGSEYEADATAAYLNALMWAVTGDEQHAQKCIEIFKTWQNLTAFLAPGTPALDAGLYLYKLVEAAEIIHSTYDGWDPADVQAFQAMLVYPGYSQTAVPASVDATHGTFYWRIYNGDSGRHGNQDLVAWRAMATLGVFLDNRVMVDRALRYFSGKPHRADDLPYASGPSVSGAQTADNDYFTTFQSQAQSTTPDYGYNGVLQHYFWENGQSQESSRDQQHAFFGLGLAAGLADVAWNQGDGVWNALDQRLLKAFEFAARYNTSYVQSFPDQSTPWEPQGAELIVRTDRTGRWRSKAVNPFFESDFVRVSRGDFPGKRPVFEEALAHFQGRMGASADATKWTTRARDVALEKYGQEPNGFSLDHPGWGGLTFRRPPGCAGDPISGFAQGRPQFALHKLTEPISLASYDYFPVAGEGRTFHDATPHNSGAYYRKDDVDLTCGPDGGAVVTDIAAGEWLTYTIGVEKAGSYEVSLHYRAAADGAQLQLSFDGKSEPDTALPGTASAWQTLTLPAVTLRAGAQSLRVTIPATATQLELATIALRPAI